MKPRFSRSDQPPSAFKSNAHVTPSSTRREGASNPKNAHQQESRITFEETSSASGAQSKSYECQHRLNTNGLQDCSQYARREDYPFYACASNDNVGHNSTQHHTLASGHADWQHGSGGRQRNNANQQMVVCQPISDNQQASGQQQGSRAAHRQLDGTGTYEDQAPKTYIRQSQEERGTSSRKQSSRLNSQAVCAAASVLTPQPKVMCVAPPFEGTAVYKGEFQTVKLSDYRGRYLCLLFYPLDFTFVCPTEILAMSDLHDQFKEVNCVVLGCSCDSPFTHLAFMKTPRVNNGLGDIAFPLLSDFKKTITASYNVLTDDGSPERALFIIDPLGIIRSITINDAGVGRNTDEVLRMVQAIKRVDDFDEMCPHGWVPDSISVAPTRPAALNYYRQMYSEKNDKKNTKQDNVGSCSSHIAYEQEKVDML